MLSIDRWNLFGWSLIRSFALIKVLINLDFWCQPATFGSLLLILWIQVKWIRGWTRSAIGASTSWFNSIWSFCCEWISQIHYLWGNALRNFMLNIKKYEWIHLNICNVQWSVSLSVESFVEFGGKATVWYVSCVIIFWWFDNMLYAFLLF